MFKLRIAQTDKFLAKLTSYKWTQDKEEISSKTSLPHTSLKLMIEKWGKGSYRLGPHGV